MKSGIVLIAAYLLTAMAPICVRSDTVPSSSCSRQAIARLRPLLETQLVRRGFAWGAPLFIRIFKEDRRLEVYLKSGDRFRLFAVYPICTYGRSELGPKTTRGDGRAPEGFYRVGAAQMNPFSRYHLAFNLGYPNGYDRQHGRTGGALMVHGGCVSIGCFAMTDGIMEQLYVLAEAALNHGQPSFAVHIFPFALEAKSLNKQRTSIWFNFWRNLQTGYIWFEKNGYPPHVNVRHGRYVFS